MAIAVVVSTTACSTPSVNLGIPRAVAAPCPDIEVVFARGTGEPPGVGAVGEAFVNSLRSKVGARSVGVYAVNYPASYDFTNSAAAGGEDARAHVQDMAVNCPDTRLVLGGMSQGAGVIDLITMGPITIRRYVAAPMAPEVADHVAAVAVFGNPGRNAPGGGPLTAISPLYGAKTIDLCAPEDLFCSRGLSLAAHLSYVKNGMTDQAADFVAARV
ncbi:cutinase family protein [Mycobacterium hodleri]|uniref:Cutinase family protein n=2 Tax=Mycolicibacterium hodleri TaxID=49897 RepID=A0A502E426_9MYCO|nr:cutinase family protein [Mycolicibacterium hodleri]